MKLVKKLSPLVLLVAFGLMANGGPAGAQDSSDIQREVMHELRMLPYYSVFDDLKFNVNGTTVTLSGDVVNPSVKSDAESAAKHVKGVTNVVDNINVLPPSPDHDRIRRAEYRATIANRSSANTRITPSRGFTSS